jgi:hypothetical protein
VRAFGISHSGREAYRSLCLLVRTRVRAFGISRSVPLAYRYPSNHRIGMVEMDKIMSVKISWFSLFQANL